jgi:hypothetical protein
MIISTIMRDEGLKVILEDFRDYLPHLQLLN